MSYHNSYEMCMVIGPSLAYGS